LICWSLRGCGAPVPRAGVLNEGPGGGRASGAAQRSRLDDALVAALTDLRKCQVKEGERAGSAYRAGVEDLAWHAAGDEYVVSDELGIPLHPESYSDEFTRMLKRAGLPKIRLHDSRHTTLSLMEKAGVPISIISKWAGHYDSSFTMKTYVHASDEDLKQGRQALAKIHRIA
jgi:integrase